MSIKRFIQKLFKKRVYPCKHSKECHHHRRDSETCQNGGGDYCGVFRNWNVRWK